MDDARERFLRNRVMTATPAQRIVLLYDRLGLDLTRALAAEDAYSFGRHLAHALEIVSELHGSLDLTAGGPAANLADIYGYLTSELLAARGSNDAPRVQSISAIVATLRAAWAQAAETVDNAPQPARAGAWVG
jgi:flagellar protein FliS